MSNNQLIKDARIHHIALQTTDWAGSLRLYQDVLGMTETARFQGGEGQTIILLDVGDGSHVELFEPKAGATPSSDSAHFFHLALATSDARAATERVRAAGYEITVEPKDVTLGALEVTISFFKGPNGELLEFFQVHGEAT